MGANTKEELFNNSLYMIERVYASRYAQYDKYQNKDDMCQEGAIGLWRAIKSGRAIKEDGTLDEVKAFMSIYCDMGAYRRRKINLDPRVKSKKDIYVSSLNEMVGEFEGIELQHLLSDTYESAEDIVIEKYVIDNFFKFFENIDKYCNLQSKYCEVVKLRAKGLTTTEVGKQLGIGQSLTSKRLKAAYNLYKDAYA